MLRLARDGDRDLVLGWRNHPRVRQASFSTGEITPSEHARWWAAVRADPRRRVLVYCHDGAPAGVVTFRLEDDGAATWGFYLDVDGLTGRGSLLPAWIGLERETIAYAFDELGACRLVGEVLARNAPVLALHQRFGFTRTAGYDRDVDGARQPVVEVQLWPTR